MISKGKLAQIHIAKAQLDLGDDEYRAILARVAGVSSAKQLTNRNVGAVLNEFRRLGWKPKAPKRAGRQPNTLDRDTMLAKVEAQLTDMGLSWQYAEAIARQQTGIQRIEWVRDYKALSAVIAALDVEQSKRDGLAALDRLLALLGKSREQLEEEYPLPRGWQRKPKVLEALIERLDQEVENRG